MAQGELVPVGQIFGLFPGKYDPYVGIKVDQYGFSNHDELVLRNGADETTIKVSSIEIERRRINVVKPGDQCAIKTAHPLPSAFANCVGMEVLVRKDRAEIAAQTEQTKTARPPRFEQIRQHEGHDHNHRSSFTR